MTLAAAAQVVLRAWPRRFRGAPVRGIAILVEALGEPERKAVELYAHLRRSGFEAYLFVARNEVGPIGEEVAEVRRIVVFNRDRLRLLRYLRRYAIDAVLPRGRDLAGPLRWLGVRRVTAEELNLHG